jgi:formylglycine-generating enzyme required for sulfatase activity
MIVNEDPSPQSSAAKIAISEMPVLVTVPAGWFWLGASPGDSLALEVEKPGREVYLGEFAIGRYPVTNKRYAQFVKATGYRLPKHWANDQISLGGIIPWSWWTASTYPSETQQSANCVLSKRRRRALNSLLKVHIAFTYLRKPVGREPDFGMTSVNYHFAERIARTGEPV